MKKKIKRDKLGRIMKGAPGRQPGSKNLFSMHMFERALAKVEKKKKKSLFEHFIEQAYEDNTVLIAAVRKILPDLKAIEVMGLFEGGMDEQTAKLIRDKFKKRFEAIHAQPKDQEAP